jgi:hypothetical protein
MSGWGGGVGRAAPHSGQKRSSGVSFCPQLVQKTVPLFSVVASNPRPFVPIAMPVDPPILRDPSPWAAKTTMLERETGPGRALERRQGGQ